MIQRRLWNQRREICWTLTAVFLRYVCMHDGYSYREQFTVTICLHISLTWHTNSETTGVGRGCAWSCNVACMNSSKKFGCATAITQTMPEHQHLVTATRSFQKRRTSQQASLRWSGLTVRAATCIHVLAKLREANSPMSAD